MRRRVEGFHQDDEGDWVAELSCLHGQHVRHRPPFFDRAWVLDESQRRARVGTELECPLCDRAELPEGLHVARIAGPFDSETLPEGLRQTHRVAEHTWGLLRVRRGTARLELETDPPLRARLEPGEPQPIPPGVAHRLSLEMGAEVTIEFLVATD